MATDSPFLFTKLSLLELFQDLLLSSKCLQLHHLDKMSVSSLPVLQVAAVSHGHSEDNTEHKQR